MRILATTDLTERGFEGIAVAARFAQAADAELVVLYVARPADGAWESESSSMAQAGEQLVDRVRAALEGQVQRVRDETGEGLRATPLLDIASNVPATDRILEVAAEIQPEMVVVTSKRASGVTGLVMGSVAQRLLRDCPCPVLIVRA